MAYLKIGTTIKVDEKLDKDIINTVQNLTKSRKMGQFIEAMLRTICSGREFDSEKISEKDIITRQELAEIASKEIESLRNQLNSIESMVNKLILDAQVKRLLGYEGVVDSTALTAMAIQKHVEQLRQSVGTFYRAGEYELDKLDNIKKHAVEVAEEIMNDINVKNNSIDMESIAKLIMSMKPVETAPITQVSQEIQKEIIEDTKDKDEEHELSDEELRDIMQFIG